MIGGFSPHSDYFTPVNKDATRSEKKEIIARIRPYAERDFADPYARFILPYLNRLGVNDIDLTYLVDEMELIQHEDSKAAKKILMWDTTALLDAMSKHNIDQIDRFLQLPGEPLFDWQNITIQTGAKKKFFRQAPQLQWLKDSDRFRGFGPNLDKALNRIGT
ncbi:hypothetical protein [Corynebacterium glaucum]|uniref:hypothetical protein n=1 Tax=Corynebacterium glaucum TaxID=187491 RepID=UPI0026593EB1|nr:hypothetical protein [Corynebacterium glaucum]